MAEEVYRIEIPIEAADRTEPALSQASSKVSRFERSMERTESRMNKLNRTKTQLIMSAIDKASGTIAAVTGKARNLAGKTFRFAIRVLDLATRPIRMILNAATSAIGLITAGAGATGGIIIPMKISGEYEQTNIAFETMLKDANKATEFLEAAEDFADKTPFEFPELTQSAKLMKAFGFEIERVLPMMTTIGDTSSGLGAGAEGIDRITRALGQMKAKGRAQTEEMLQLQELGIPAAQILQEELGLTAKQVANIGEEGLEAGKVIDALLRGMDKRFGGMMTKQSSTAIGLMSTISDTIKNKLLRKWGEGLWDGFKPGLTRIVDWLDKNKVKVKSWGDEFRKAGEGISKWVVGKLDQVQDRIGSLTNSTEWKNATTIGEKMKLAWDKVIEEPFEEWWKSKGQAWITKSASNIGSAMGGALGNFIMSALGVVSDPEKAMQESPFISAGRTAGKAFLDSFVEAFDAEKVANKLLEAMKSIGKDAAKVLPGGESPTGTSWLSAILTAVAGGWAGGKLFKATKIGKRVIDFSKNIFRGGKTATTAAQAGAAATIAAETAATASKVPIYGANGEVIKTVTITAQEAKTAATATKTGSTAAKAASAVKAGSTAVNIGKAIASAGPQMIMTTAADIFIRDAIKRAEGEAEFKRSMAAEAADQAQGKKGYWTVPKDNPWYDPRGIYQQTAKQYVGADEISELRDNLSKQEMSITQAEPKWSFWKWISGEYQKELDAYNKTQEEAQRIKEQMQGLAKISADEISESRDNLAKRKMSITQAVPKWSFWKWISGEYQKELDAYKKAQEDAQKIKEQMQGPVRTSAATKPFDIFMPDFGSSITKPNSIPPHANGGIMTRPHIGLVAEAGAEAIIPLSGGKRQRGIDLWEQTGRFLGIVPYAEGGIAGRPTETPVYVPVGKTPGRPNVTIKVKTEAKFEIKTGANAGEVLEAIRQHQGQIADELSDEIAEKLAKIFSNMPQEEVA